MKPSRLGDSPTPTLTLFTSVFVWRLLTKSLISLIDTGLFVSSISSWMSFGHLYFSRNLFTTSKLWMYNCHNILFTLIMSLKSIVMFSILFLILEIWVFFLTVLNFLKNRLCVFIDFSLLFLSFLFHQHINTLIYIISFLPFTYGFNLLCFS